MMQYLGGPEDAAALDQRHERYVALAASGNGEMFRIVAGIAAVTAGDIGYWCKTWRDDEIFEAGWQMFMHTLARESPRRQPLPSS